MKINAEIIPVETRKNGEVRSGGERADYRTASALQPGLHRGDPRGVLIRKTLRGKATRDRFRRMLAKSGGHKKKNIGESHRRILRHVNGKKKSEFTTRGALQGKRTRRKFLLTKRTGNRRGARGRERITRIAAQKREGAAGQKRFIPTGGSKKRGGEEGRIELGRGESKGIPHHNRSVLLGIIDGYSRHRREGTTNDQGKKPAQVRVPFSSNIYIDRQRRRGAGMSRGKKKNRNRQLVSKKRGIRIP